MLFLYTVLYCFHWEHQQVDGVQSAHGGFLRYEGIGQIPNWYGILKEENLGFHLNIYLSAILKKFSNYAQLYIHIYCCFFTLYCIVTTGSTSKLMECKVHTEALLRYEGIGQIQNWYGILKEENLGFHLNIYLSAILKNFSNYAQLYIHIYCCFFTLYCIVSTGSTSKLMECKVHTEALLRYEGIGQIQNWYGILKEENLGFHLNIYLSAILENFSNYIQV